MALPIITVEQMREWERASWEAGRAQAEVIERVGKIVADRALAMSAPHDRVVVLAGAGHNGDDGRAAVPHLLNREVKLLEVRDPKEALAELAALLKSNPRLVIDALFGIGLNRPLSEDWIRFIGQLNASSVDILSVDVPSGFDAEKGTAEGAAVQAAVTLTLGAVKRGMLSDGAWPFVGRLEIAPEIGLIPCPFLESNAELQWSTPDDFQSFFRRRPVSSHKGTFGHVAIIAGSLGYHGAAILAARGAQQAHPGLITLCTQAETYLPIASQLQSVMVHPWPSLIRLEETCSALIVGPGLASRSVPQDIKTTVKRFWRTLRQPMIVDASALDWMDPAPVPPDLIRIVTPHPGEAARMLGVTVQSVQADRSLAVRHLAERFGNCWVALKGHQTLVGRAKGPIFVNSSGNPFLAQGGSGDVLAGFLAGLMAQPALQKDPGLLIRYAVWAHGAAADRLSAKVLNWTIEDLAAALGHTDSN